MADVNAIYLTNKKLNVEVLGRGMAWLDTGTHESLLQECNFIQTLQERQGLMVACIEEIAYSMGFITTAQLEKIIEGQKKSSYGQYLHNLLLQERKAGK
jgi:glucose-1-phosphate thymidylyltransferase